MKDRLIDVRSLSLHFPVRRGLLQRIQGHVRAVDEVNFSIAPGETLGLVGESGCGKTSVGRTLLRLYEPTGGTIYFEGRDIAALPAGQLRSLRKDMQMVFQDPYSSLNPRLTVARIVQEGLAVHRVGSRREQRERVLEVLEQVGIDATAANRYPHEFSGGQRQRISIARALTLNPRFLILDEPISALDVSIQSQVINLLIDLRNRYQLTYLFISHDLSVVEYISDRVAVMYLGEIVEIARSRDLYRNAQHPYTQALLASIPKQKPSAVAERPGVRGDVPSPLDPPSGCRFHPRCPLAAEVCRHTPPPPVQIADDHEVRCHAAEGDS